MQWAIVVGLLAAVQCVSGLYGSSSSVIILNPSSFDAEVVHSDSPVLVEFFAPWCGHCKSLAPAWEKAASALRGAVKVAAVDCDAHPQLAQQFGVKGFPTIKLFSPHLKSPLDYEGGRDAKPIVDYAISQLKSLTHARLSGKVGASASGSGSRSSSGSDSSESASVELTSDSFDDLVLQSKELWMVEFFAPWCGHCKSLAPEWKRAAGSLKGQVHFGQVDCTVEESLARKYGIQGFPTILVFGKDKENPTRYEGERSAGAIEQYALNTLDEMTPVPEAVEVTGATSLSGCTSSTICFIAFLPHILDSGAAGRSRYLEILKAAADKHTRSKYRYVWAEAGAQPALENTFGVGGYGYPALIAVNSRKKVFGTFKSAFDSQHISDFIRELAYGGRLDKFESLPDVKETTPWDGNDAPPVEEEEFSLEDLMGDEVKPSEEL